MGASGQVFDFRFKDLGQLDELDGDDLFCEDTECEVIMDDSADETESAELSDETVTA